MRLRADNPDSFPRLVAILSRGGIAIAPGDTMYGLIGKAPETDGALRRVKGRGEDKPFLLLLRDAGWLPRLTDAAVPPRLARYWPGPLTLVLPARAGGTVAVRIPDSPFLARLLQQVNAPLYSTSVNRSGQQPFTGIDAICAEFQDEVDAIYDAGDAPAGPPSTLVDVSAKPFRVIRQGALVIPPEELA